MRDRKSHRAARGEDAHKRGHRAESLCCLALRLRGYKIIARRYKSHQGEIDIVAARGMTLAFIEVKARPSYLAASEAVSEHQKARMGRCASLFLAHYRGFSRYTMRFDIMIVLPWHWPVHVENAFQTAVRI